MKKALLLHTQVQSVTQSVKRPEDERHLSFDIGTFNQTDFELAVNDETGTNEASAYTLPAGKTFAYIYAPYTVELTLNGTLTVPDFKGLFVLSASLQSVRLRNRSLERAVVCSAIIA